MPGTKPESCSRMRGCRSCRATFTVCVRCDRGQAYCSTACRLHARVRQTRAAKARYQKTETGRASNRERQRRLRDRERQARVTDQSSYQRPDCINSPIHITQPAVVADASTKPSFRNLVRFADCGRHCRAVHGKAEEPHRRHSILLSGVPLVAGKRQRGHLRYYDAELLLLRSLRCGLGFSGCVSAWDGRSRWHGDKFLRGDAYGT